MRIKKFAIWVLSTSLLLPAIVSAQTAKASEYHWFIAPELGFAISPEAATDYYSKGFGISVGIEYPVAPKWSIVGMVNYKTFSPDEGRISGWWSDPGEYPGSSNIKVSEGTLSALTFAAISKGVLQKEGSKTWPYIKGGFGLSLAGADEVKVDYTDNIGSPQTEWAAGANSDINIAVLLGFGLEMAHGDAGQTFFAELGFEVILLDQGNNPGIAPIRVGYKF